MGELVTTRVRRDRAPRPSRTLDERLLVRFPPAYAAFSALAFRVLSPRSRLRRSLVRRAVLSGWDAASRRDLDLTLVRYAPEVEIEFDPEFEPLGLGGTFHGHEGVREMLRGIQEGWERWTITPELLIDLGDLVLTLGTMYLPGTASGLELRSELTQLIEVGGGVVVREREFLSWEKGVRAAGLDPRLAIPDDLQPP